MFTTLFTLVPAIRTVPNIRTARMIRTSVPRPRDRVVC